VAGAGAAASVVAEVLLTTINQYVFAALGLALVVAFAHHSRASIALLWGLALALPLPVAFALTLRYGKIFERIARIARSLLGDSERLREILGHSASLDTEIRRVFGRTRELLAALAWQLAGILLGSVETWFALRLLGNPVDPWVAVTLESLTTTLRNFVFFVPAGLGVQEVGLVLFGQLVGVDPQIAVALSLAKRLRELVFGLPALLSWQWSEGLRLRARKRRDPAGPGGSPSAEGQPRPGPG
jgi:putative membrane protein